MTGLVKNLRRTSYDSSRNDSFSSNLFSHIQFGYVGLRSVPICFDMCLNVNCTLDQRFLTWVTREI